MPARPTGAHLPTFTRLAGMAAIGFAAVIVGTNAVLVPAGMPPVGADADQAVAFFSGSVLARSMLAAIPAAWVLSTLFAAGAVAALRGQRGCEGWSLVGLTGVLAQNVTFAGVVGVRLALPAQSSAEFGGAAALWTFHDAIFGLNGTFLAPAMVGFSLAGLRAGLIHRWLGGLGLTAAALQGASATLTPWVIEQQGPLGLIGLGSWLLWVVWLVAFGLRLIRADRNEPEADSFTGQPSRPVPTEANPRADATTHSHRRHRDHRQGKHPRRR